MGAECWWGNEPGSSHGDSPGEIDAAGTYTLSSAAEPLGGATEIIAHVIQDELELGALHLAAEMWDAGASGATILTEPLPPGDCRYRVLADAAHLDLPVYNAQPAVTASVR